MKTPVDNVNDWVATVKFRIYTDTIFTISMLELDIRFFLITLLLVKNVSDNLSLAILSQPDGFSTKVTSQEVCIKDRDATTVCSDAIPSPNFALAGSYPDKARFLITGKLHNKNSAMNMSIRINSSRFPFQVWNINRKEGQWLIGRPMKRWRDQEQAEWSNRCRYRRRLSHKYVHFNV